MTERASFPLTRRGNRFPVVPWTENNPGVNTELRIQLEGEVDVQTSTEIRDRLVAAAAEAGDGTLVVDLGLVTFLDSSGLSALIAGLKALRARGGRMHIVNPSPVVARTLEITGMTGQFGLDGAGAGENVDVGGE